MLRRLGFPARWCLWVEGILASARSSVLVNGAPTFEFDYKKGIRQGDPLSPFLFVIVMEALSSIFKKASDIRAFDSIRLPNGGPEELEAQMKRFLWGGSDEVKRLHWVGWDKVVVAKNKGGLGLNRLENSNKESGRLEFEKYCKVSGRLLKVGGASMFGWRWKHDPTSLEETLELTDCFNMLMAVKLSEKKDSRLWHGTGSEFSVANIKAWITSTDVPVMAAQFDWCKWITLKSNVFMWRAFLERLPTKVALIKRNIQVENNNCIFCDDSDETAEHIFMVSGFICVQFKRPHGDIQEHAAQFSDKGNGSRFDDYRMLEDMEGPE
ncbi:uncharacterized protein LOC110892744 [Helianthus annuus]|uniref:uncharacterized protein LOC110892744 n=1 Tax=Helianthus annuus TaxID=4232 RepID=UPI000B9026C0|nr:uncharacterized protein LOC110892744 [Helianthus annuus]